MRDLLDNQARLVSRRGRIGVSILLPCVLAILATAYLLSRAPSTPVNDVCLWAREGALVSQVLASAQHKQLQVHRAGPDTIVLSRGRSACTVGVYQGRVSRSSLTVGD